VALTATLALVALPGLAGSRTSSERAPVPASAFQPLLAPASGPDSAIPNAGIDLGYLSSGYVLTDAPILERADLPPVDPPVRAQPDQPDPGATSTRKPPLQTLSGEATFYDAGHTAMRLPAGTVIVVCGAGGCLEGSSATTARAPARGGSSTCIDRTSSASAAAPRGAGSPTSRSTSTDVRPAVSLRLTFGCGPVRPPAWPCEAGKER